MWPQVKLILMPLTLMGIQYGITAAAQSIGSANPTADALAQWLNCGPMAVRAPAAAPAPTSLPVAGGNSIAAAAAMLKAPYI